MSGFEEGRFALFWIGEGERHWCRARHNDRLSAMHRVGGWTPLGLAVLPGVVERL
jgi:hypothetical protein